MQMKGRKIHIDRYRIQDATTVAQEQEHDRFMDAMEVVERDDNAEQEIFRKEEVEN